MQLMEPLFIHTFLAINKYHVNVVRGDDFQKVMIICVVEMNFRYVVVG